MEQVGQHTPHLLRVDQRPDVVADAVVERQAGALGLGRQPRDHFVNQGGQRRADHAHRHPPGFDQRQVVHLAGQLSQRVNLAADLIQQSIPPGAIVQTAGAQRIDQQPDGGQRRAQLVRDVGHEIAPRPPQALQFADIAQQKQSAGAAPRLPQRARLDAEQAPAQDDLARHILGLVDDFLRDGVQLVGARRFDQAAAHGAPAGAQALRRKVGVREQARRIHEEQGIAGRVGDGLQIGLDAAGLFQHRRVIQAQLAQLGVRAGRLGAQAARANRQNGAHDEQDDDEAQRQRPVHATTTREAYTARTTLAPVTRIRSAAFTRRLMPRWPALT